MSPLFANPCPSLEAPAPTVCIDGQLNATPDQKHVHRGETVHFFLNAPGELSIETPVLESVNHEGGHAWGTVRSDAPYGSAKYTIINLTTRDKRDPTLIIDP